MTEHPLPEEIRKMNRDETVCKFCGVSYLIHNEIKALEDKLRACQNELKKYQGCEEREEKLQLQISKLEALMEDIKGKFSDQENLIESLQTSLREKEVAQEEALEDKKRLEERLQTQKMEIEASSEKNDEYRTVLVGCIGGMHGCIGGIQELRKSIDDLKKVSNEDVSNLWSDAKEALNHVSELHSKEIQVVRAQIQEKEEALKSAKEKEDSYQRKIKSLETGQSDLMLLRNEIKELEEKCRKQENELKGSHEEQRELGMKIEQFKALQKKHAAELEQAQLDKQNLESYARITIAKVENDLKSKESLIIKLETELQELKRMYDDKLLTEQEIRQNSKTANTRIEEVQRELNRVRGDCEALKKEREMMITAHQNQIEQLRESFKRKTAETDKWEAKLSEALEEAKRKHDKELQMVELRLKENFVLEMQIEKQKMEELMEKKTKSSRENETLVKSQLAQSQHKHKSEIAELHRQIAENKARGREMEDSLRREIESLKKIIKDLELRLSKLASDEPSVEVKGDLRKANTELSDLRNEKVKLERDVKAAKDEITFLQDTVRRECEERFELTEALSVVKEELLAFKRKPSNNTRIGSASSTISGHSSGRNSARGLVNDNVEFYKQATPRDLEQRNRLVPNSSRESVDAKPLNLGFQGAKEKEKPENLESTRKRIAQLMGRK